jgi:hypothetical protein
VTTDTTPTTSSNSPDLRQWIILAALAACLIIGGGIVYWFVFAGGSSVSTVKVDPAKQKPRAMPRSPEMPGVTRLGTERWSVRGSVGSIDIKRSGEKYHFDYNFVSGYQPSPLLLAASRATRDDAMAKEWGVTRDQRKMIRAEFDSNPSFDLTAGEVSMLNAIWERYLAATDVSARGAASKDLQQKIDEIVKGKLDHANEALQRNERKIREILSPESLDKMVKK